jgi:hypothetical protein
MSKYYKGQGDRHLVVELETEDGLGEITKVPGSMNIKIQSSF